MSPFVLPPSPPNTQPRPNSPVPTDAPHSNTEVFKFKFKPQVHLSPLYLYQSKKRSVFPRPGWLAWCPGEGWSGGSPHSPHSDSTETPKPRGMTKRPQRGRHTCTNQARTSKDFVKLVIGRRVHARAQPPRAHEGWGREGREGGGGHHIQKLPRTETPTQTHKVQAKPATYIGLPAPHHHAQSR